jgi:hypothetical protein
MDMADQRSVKKMVMRLLVALILSLMVTAFVAGIGSYLIATEGLAESGESLICVIALLLSSVAASVVMVSGGNGTRILLCLAGSGVYYGGLLCCGALVFDGVKQGMGIHALVVAFGAIVVWLLGLRGGKKRPYKVPKIRG